LPAITDPNVLVGTRTADDAAVYRVSDELAIIQTVDFFTPVVDDPYLFGAIAAANSLSDVYAMGGKPTMALNIVGFPRKNDALPLSVLGDILRGGADKAAEAGISIVGGHSIDDNEPKYGLCVTGFVHPKRYWTNVGAQPGDKLILTKPIGVGIITTALRSGFKDATIEKQAIDTMATLNRKAAEAAQSIGVHACTDVTGFGLLGHLREMLEGVGVQLNLSCVPILDGVHELAKEDYIPGGTHRNLKAVSSSVQFDPSIPELDQLILADAQTSGGLLFAVAPENSTALLNKLAQAGVSAKEIGHFTDLRTGTIQVHA
jgi:selenide,water dikinase